VSDVVLDASAVLAAIKDEPGGQQIAQVARGARMSAVNYSEVVGWLAQRGSTAEDIERVIGPFDLIIEPFDQSRAQAAGLLAARAKRRNISFGDRACLALALELDLPVMTGDRAWRDLEIGIDIRLFR
jgi:PIN domain nuclease of toxin-antitoxin system